MIKGKLRVFRYGNSKAMRIFKSLNTVEEPTAVAENLMLVDPMGEVPETVLASWLAEIEDRRLEWIKEKRAKRNQKALIGGD